MLQFIRLFVHIYFQFRITQKMVLRGTKYFVELEILNNESFLMLQKQLSQHALLLKEYKKDKTHTWMKSVMFTIHFFGKLVIVTSM